MGPRNTDTGGGGQNTDRLYEEISRILEFQKSGLSDSRIDVTRLTGDDQGIATLVNQLIELFLKEHQSVSEVLGSVVEGSFIADVPRLPGTRGQISEQLSQILGGLALMQTDVSRFSDACQSGDLSARLDPSRYIGGFREMIDLLDSGFDAFVIPVRMASAGIADFADGKIPDLVEAEKFPGDLGRLLKDLNRIVEVSKIRGEDINMLISSAIEGRLDARADPTKYPGYHGRIIEGINKMLDAYIGPINVSAEYLDRISKGDLPPRIIEVYRGDFNEIKNNLNALIDVVHMRNEDIKMLINSGVDGRLDVRADAKKYPGDNGIMIEGINKMLDAYIGPINVSAEYIDRISKGDLPPKITEPYRGDFNEIKNNLNNLIDVVHLRNADIKLLIEAAIDGNLDFRADPKKYHGENGKMIEGINNMLDAYIGPINVSAEYIDRISKGDIPPRITEAYHGDFNEIKNNLNTLIDVVHLRNDDINLLSAAALEGRLDVRADISKYTGYHGGLIDKINKILDSYLGPINVSAEYIDRISKGDMPPKIKENYRGDFNEIKNNLNALIDVVLMRNADIKDLIDSAIDGNLDFRADSKKYPGENGKMIDGINSMLDAYIGPINVSAEYIDRISKGDIPPKITEAYRGDFNEIKNNLNALIDVVLMRNTDIKALIESAIDGDLDFRADSKKYPGENGKMIEGINSMLDAYIGPINVSAEYIDRISKGDMPPKIFEAYRGDFNEIKNNLNALIDVVSMRNADIKALIEAAIDGNLDFRADFKKYPGENGKMIEGINSMLDAYIGPINVSAEYIDRISKGDIPPKIIDEYHGDFNEIKNNLNALMDVVHMRNADIQRLIQAAIDGKLDVRADSSKYPGENGRMIDGINSMLDAYIGPINVSAEYIDRISKGDIPPRIAEVYHGDFNEIKNNLNTLIDVVHLRNDDINLLSTAALEGRLDVRADISKYTGYHGGLIDKINKILDSYLGPVNVSAEYIDRISKGDIPPKISEDYRGDFNEIKNNLNALIDVVLLRNSDIKALIEAAVDGNLDFRADFKKYSGENGKMIEGINNMLDAYIGPINVSAEYIDRISKGDIPPRIAEVYHGDFNEIKNNLNTLIDVVHLRNDDINLLSTAALEGRLDVRADISKYTGYHGGLIDKINKILDSYLGPVNVSAEYIDRISKGDIPPRIAEVYHGDFNEIKNNLNALMDVVHMRNTDIQNLIQAAIEGKLDVRADSSRYPGENGKMIDGINSMLDAYIGPINVAAEYIDRISKGDLPPVITDDYHGDFNEIKNNLNSCITTLSHFVSSMDHMYQDQKSGEIDSFLDEGEFIGIYQEMARGVNEDVRLHVSNILKILGIIVSYAKGDFSPVLERLPGKQVVANENLDLLRSNLIQLTDDVGLLGKGAIDGRLDIRADVSRYHGDFLKIAEGFNMTLDAVINPLNLSAEYIDRISKGDIPPKISEDYRGDFNEIKNNLNALIDVVHMRNNDIEMLIQAAVDGKLDVRADSSKYPGDNGKMLDGINHMLDAYIGPLNLAAEYIDRISKGDLPPKITDDYKGDFNEIKNNLNQCIGAIHLLIDDVNLLSEATVKGDLDARADPNRHMGDYSRVVTGMNQTLDAVVFPLREAMRVSELYAKCNFSELFDKNIRADGEFSLFKNSLNNIGEEISVTIDKLKKEIDNLSHHAVNAHLGVEDVSKGAKEISHNAEETSDNAEKAEDGIDQVLQAMSELTIMVSEISGNADSVARLSEEANNLAKKGTEYAENADKGMVSITRSSTEVETIITEIRSEMNQIRKIVNIITDLANQTNLLALNAAIEAARAGDAGRGFAVVASEVKSLAQESRSSAESIADMIQGLERKSDSAAVAIEAAGKAVKEGNKAMIDTLNVFTQLTGSVDTINQKMLTIARSTEQQAASFEEITASANEMSTLVKKTADDATHSSATSEEALAVVSQITDIIDLINNAVANMHKEMEIFTVRKL